MSTTQITGRVIDQTIQLANLPLLSSGSVGVVQIRFDFCSLWDGYGKTAVFYRTEADVYHVPMEEGVATVPHEVLEAAGYFYFGIFGAADNVRTTEVVRVTVAKGAITDATVEPQDPTPDVYQQLLAAYGRAESEVIEIRQRFEETLKQAYNTFDLLWENPDPSASFSGTTVNIGVDVVAKYSGLLVTYKQTNSDPQDSFYVILPSDLGGYGDTITGVSGGYMTRMLCFAKFDGIPYAYTRAVWVSAGTVYFEDTTTGSNAWLIPCKIYGVIQNVRTDIDALAAAAVEKLFVPVTQEEYDALVADGTIDANKYYMIVGES